MLKGLVLLCLIDLKLRLELANPKLFVVELTMSYSNHLEFFITRLQDVSQETILSVPAFSNSSYLIYKFS
jgi:hypothetical protein